jgi:hypothetical protein
VAITKMPVVWPVRLSAKADAALDDVDGSRHLNAAPFPLGRDMFGRLRRRTIIRRPRSQRRQTPPHFCIEIRWTRGDSSPPASLVANEVNSKLRRAAAITQLSRRGRQLTYSAYTGKWWGGQPSIPFPLHRPPCGRKQWSGDSSIRAKGMRTGAERLTYTRGGLVGCADNENQVSDYGVNIGT